MSDCQPCKALDCVNPDDYATYNLDGPATFPAVPVPAPTVVSESILNQEVYFAHACSLTETLTYTGTLPTWITLDTTNNRLVGRAGVFGAATQAEADALAQAALDSFGNAALTSGALSCVPNDPCLSVTDWLNAPGSVRLRIKNYTPGSYFVSSGCVSCNPSVNPEWDGTFSVFFAGFGFVADNGGGPICINGNEVPVYSSGAPVGYPIISVRFFGGRWIMESVCDGSPALVIWEDLLFHSATNPLGLYFRHPASCATNAFIEVECYSP